MDLMGEKHNKTNKRRYSMKKAVISIGAGKSQALIIQKAKDIGFAVIGVDRNRHAPCFDLCDEKIYISTHEPNEIIEHLRAFNELYDLLGVINRSSGIPVVTGAEISKAFHLPGVKPNAAKIIIDKSQLISFCNENNISAPRQISVKAFNELDNFEFDYPCIIKPSLSNVGKSGVFRVDREVELKKAFFDAKNHSVNGVVNIEEYVEGYDVTLMSVVQKGVVYPITLLDEINKIDRSAKYYGVGFAIPSRFTNKVEESKIHKLAQKIVTTFQLDTTVFLMSCKCSFGSTPKLIEIHLDIGGDLILDKLIPASTTYDVLGQIINVLTQEEFCFQKLNFNPTAIVYEQGEGLVSERGCFMYEAKDRQILEDELARI